MTSPTPSLAAPVDGRQSAAALDIARGTKRMLLAHGFASVAELPLANGRRADLIAISDKGEIWIVEIKSGVEDFRSDAKWPEYREFCDRLFFAVDGHFPRELLPSDTGHIIADRFGAEIVQPAPLHQLAGARRKALTLRIARAAAMRLTLVADPELALERTVPD